MRTIALVMVASWMLAGVEPKASAEVKPAATAAGQAEAHMPPPVMPKKSLTT